MAAMPVLQDDFEHQHIEIASGYITSTMDVSPESLNDASGVSSRPHAVANGYASAALATTARVRTRSTCAAIAALQT